jgi:hypothetical protein
LGAGEVALTGKGGIMQAHQAIGEFFCEFSELERELGETIKVFLRLRENPAADAIVGLVGDFARKANVVLHAVQGTEYADGSPTSEEWKANTAKTIEKILGCNNPDRRDLAHDYLEPHLDGSLALQKPGQNPRTWSSESLRGKIEELQRLTLELRKLNSELTNLNITVPTAYGWLTADPPTVARTTCPICGAEAEELSPTGGDFHHIRCPTHDEFEVSGTAMSIRGGKASSDHWETALERAKLRSETGKRPRILDEDFS